MTTAWTIVGVATALFAPGPLPAGKDGERYEYRRPTRDGSGKIYLGREISRVMGHEGARWLDRPTREREERTDLLLGALGVQAGDVIADVGAGTGYFSLPLARLARKGRVLAVDIQPEMLGILQRKAREAGLSNIEPILGEEADPRLPTGAVDLVLLVDVYHELAFPFEMMERIARSLTPDGRVALVEYRAEDPLVPIKPLHKMSQAQVKRELKKAGLVWIETLDLLPQQHLMLFGLPSQDASTGRRRTPGIAAPDQEKPF